MNPLLELAPLGQSYWIDDLTRTMLKSGELRRRVTEEGLTGVTSNPSIFNTAIRKSDDYDGQIRELAAQPAISIYEALIVTDVRDACDILRPVYDRTEGRDGFVSLEVSPHLARDAQGSIAEARRFWLAVARPNLFIKLPGTPEGTPAIEELLVEGININITLLFSIERYEAVALAYLRALERRKAETASINRVASVASFFLSRIDTLVDELLLEKVKGGNPDAERLLGRCAVANAKLAYQRFKEIASSARWRSLERVGARPQRLLWASTSTKNPSYDDLMYVEPLIGPKTINTLPPKTIAAFAHHGTATASLQQGLDEAMQVMRDLKKTGIDLPRVTERLLDEGIKKFSQPFDELLKTIAERGKKLSGARGAGPTR
ncbi:MAG: transaldolase [Gammaproteobacteria bacterium]